MASTPDHPTQRRCPCRGVNPNCPQCGGTGVIQLPGVRSTMAGPAGVRRRLPVSRESLGTPPVHPEPMRCPHCGLEVLHLALHVTEAHPEQSQHDMAVAEREAREQEAVRQAFVAAEIARCEAEAAQRKAEARARRQALEGPQAAVAGPGPAWGPLQRIPRRSQGGAPGRPADTAAQADPTGPAGAQEVGTPGRGQGRPPGSEAPRRAEAESRHANPADEAWARMRQALAERTVLTGVIRSRRPFGVFVSLGGIDGLVRWREMPAEEPGRETPGLHDGQTVKVVVIGMSEDTRHVELSMRRVGEPRAPRTERGATTPEARPAEGPMALAFRLAREKKKQGE